jgi:2-polyprenyl-3-methyl-5-hydroxy-6-metoxy-1,4-benzoquinol methylase
MMKRLIRVCVKLLPLRFRLWLRRKFGSSWFGVQYTQRVVGLEEAYGADFVLDSLSEKASADLEAIADSLYSSFLPKTAMDVGCGAPVFLKRMCEHGVRAYGCDVSRSAEAACREANIEFAQVDMSKDGALGAVQWCVDMVVCMEVAEHIPKKLSRRLVSCLCTSCDTGGVVCFSAAPVGQGGVMHINEQPASYWIDLFAQEGMVLDAEMGAQLKNGWSAVGIVNPRVRNFLLFRRNSASVENHNG